MTRLLIIALIFVLVGCHQDESTGKISKIKIDLSQSDEDFVIPTPLWKTLESAYPDLTQIAAPIAETDKKEEKKDDKKEKKGEKKLGKEELARKQEEEELFKRRPVIDPLLFSVSLTEKTLGVLANKIYELNFDHGGGALDLKDYVSEAKNGTFSLKVKYGEEMDPKFTKVFYLSNSQSGSGCNKYFDITKYWRGIMKNDGLILNTVDSGHIKITAGTFFFVSPFKGKLRLGHLTIKDSHHPELLCKVDSRN